jgi:hypothetical protein
MSDPFEDLFGAAAASLASVPTPALPAELEALIEQLPIHKVSTSSFSTILKVCIKS